MFLFGYAQHLSDRHKRVPCRRAFRPVILVAEMENSMMKKLTLALAVLVALAVVAVPAVAAPLLKVTWDGSGVTDVDPRFSNLYVQGDPIRFAGHAMMTEDGTWKVHGTFDGTLDGQPILIRVRTDERGYMEVADDGTRTPVFVGLADVTYGGVRYRHVSFSQSLSEQPNGIQYFQMVIVGPDTGDLHAWYISGPNKITKGFLAFR